MLNKIKIETPPKESFFSITEQVEAAVQESGVKEGICVLTIPHTTAGLTLNSKMDTATLADLVNELRRIVPTRVDFDHIFDTPADAAGHIKSSLVGTTLSLVIADGRLLLGGSQGIFFCEFDGPRTRQIIVRILGEG